MSTDVRLVAGLDGLVAGSTKGGSPVSGGTALCWCYCWCYL